MACVRDLIRRISNTSRADLRIFKESFSSIQTRFHKLTSNSNYKLEEEVYEKLERLSERQRIQFGNSKEIRRGTKPSQIGNGTKIWNKEIEEKANLIANSSNSCAFTFDDKIRTIIASNITEKLPSLPRQIRRGELEKADSETISNFTRSSNCYSGCVLTLLIRAGLLASEHLGIITGEVKTNPRKPRQILDCVEELSKNTNSGYPFYGRKNDEVIKYNVRKWVEKVYENPNPRIILSNNFGIDEDYFSVMNNPCKIYYRFQIKAKEVSNSIFEFIVKHRQVFCVPFGIVAIEARYFRDIIERVKHHQSKLTDPIYPSGENRSEISVRHILKHRECLPDNPIKDYYLVSGDYSKLDQSIEPIMVDLFFAICETTMDLNEKEKQVYNYLRMYTKFTPLIYKGFLFFMTVGISSGLLITNLFDSFVSLTLLYFTHLTLLDEDCDDVFYGIIGYNDLDDVKIDPIRLDNTIFKPLENFSIYGDDSIIYNSEKFFWRLKRICHYFSLNIEFENIARTKKDPIFFLGTFWDQNNEPFQSRMYMISHMIFREKWFRSKKEIVDRGYKDFDDFTLARCLAICLRFKNGLEEILILLKGWKPFEDWYLNKNAGFIRPSGWPFDKDTYISRDMCLHWSYY
jgi:hypothetical protein